MKSSRPIPSWPNWPGGTAAARGGTREAGTEPQFGIIPPDPTDSRDTIETRRRRRGRVRVVLCRPAPNVHPLRRELQRVEQMDASASDLAATRRSSSASRGRTFSRIEIRERRPSRAGCRDGNAGARPHEYRHRRRAARGREVDLQLNPDELEINVCRARPVARA